MPGFEGVQLPVSTKIMPTAMTVLNDGTLAFTSLEGHVYLAKDTDGDGVEDTLTMFEEGLSAPYGIIQDGDSLLVSHKPEILRLRDTDGDGRADERTVFSAGWGFNDNYHDWTCGIAKDAQGNFYVGIGSDYAQLKRPKGCLSLARQGAADFARRNAATVRSRLPIPDRHCHRRPGKRFSRPTIRACRTHLTN